MKRGLMCFTAIVFSLVLSFPVSAAPKNEPLGYRGIKWGNEIKELADMKLLSGAKEDEKFYERKGDPIHIGRADIQTVEYGFYKSRFYMTTVKFKEEANFKELKKTLEEQFGSGKQLNPRLEQYAWDWENVSVTIHYSAGRNEGKIIYYYKPIAKEKKKDEKQKQIEKSRSKHGSD